MLAGTYAVNGLEIPQLPALAQDGRQILQNLGVRIHAVQYPDLWRQVNGWSCGHHVLHFANAVANGLLALSSNQAYSPPLEWTDFVADMAGWLKKVGFPKSPLKPPTQPKRTTRPGQMPSPKRPAAPKAKSRPAAPKAKTNVQVKVCLHGKTCSRLLSTHHVMSCHVMSSISRRGQVGGWAGITCVHQLKTSAQSSHIKSYQATIGAWRGKLSGSTRAGDHPRVLLHSGACAGEASSRIPPSLRAVCWKVWGEIRDKHAYRAAALL